VRVASGRFHTQHSSKPMRTIEDYRAKAIEFYDIASETKHPELKQRYRDLAQSYRALADARERAISDGSAEPHVRPQ
jgi:hypothetical protein